MDDRKVFVGMTRGKKPSFDGGVYICPRNHSQGGIAGGDPMTCYNGGCYDTPVYVTVDEIIDRVAQKIIDKEMT